MENSGAIGGFTQEARDRSTVVAQLFPQNLDRNRAVLRMLGAVNNRGAALTDLLANGVTGESCSGEVLARHVGEANPLVGTQQASRVTSEMLSFTMFSDHAPSGLPGGRLAIALLGALLLVTSCRGPRATPGPGVPEPRQTPARGTPSTLLDPTDLYQRNGMIARTTPMAFVGSVRFLPTRSTDSTLVLVALSMPNRSLTFSGAGDRQEAAYTVITEARRSGIVVQRREARETVRVASFRETTRGDESVIFQQFMTLSPGDYELAVIVRDGGSARSGAYELASSVPQLSASVVAPPIIAYEATPRTNADSLPHLIANPRATIIFGRDTMVPVYVEQATVTESSSSEATLSVLSEEGTLLWSDTVALQSGVGLASGLGQVPTTRFGVGHFWITTTPTSSVTPAVRVPLFISFGDEWGIAPLEEMLSYLRYFADPARLRALQDAAPEARASAWMTFWRETDPDPETTEHEALRDYFRRLVTVNERFREEASAGWLTERGKVFITLGEPDQILEQGDVGIGSRGRLQIWQYLQHRTQFVFVDQSGFGRWRMTPASESEFESIALRVRRR